MRLASTFGWNKDRTFTETRCRHNHTVLSEAVQCADDRYATAVLEEATAVANQGGHFTRSTVLKTYVVVVGR